MKKNEPELTKDEKQKRAHRDVFLDYMPYLVIILIVVIIRTYIATPIRVNGSSMDTTLKSGETMVLNKLAMHLKGLKRWDIIVVKTKDSYLIKRIIALPGEKIKYQSGVLYINNEIIADKYSLTKTEDFEEVKVGADEYFVMGDNRAVSQDSRNPLVGPVAKKDIKGKTNIVLFPFDRFGIVE